MEENRSPISRSTPALLAVVAALGLLLAGCGGGRPVDSSAYPSTANPKIVASHTSGPISSESRILLQFVDEVAPQASAGSAVAGGVIRVSPSIPGQWLWSDSRTIELKPSQVVPRGRKYTVDVSLKSLDAKRFVGQPAFRFTFSIKTQSVSLETEGFQSVETGSIYELVFTGTVRTADVADPAAVEKTLGATLDGKRVSIEWVHSKLEHPFSIKGILKEGQAKTLSLSLDGSPVGASQKETQSYSAPARKPFQILDVQALESPERYVEVSFSDPLQAGQDYRGFVHVTPSRPLSFAAQGSILKVYSASEWDNDTQVSVEKGIKNAAGDPLGQGSATAVAFKPLLPGVRFVGNGVIVPGKPGVTVPIETVNLNAIIVQVEKIYASNIPQFLQVNELSGGEEVRRVGATIWKKIVPVPFSADRRNQWIRTGLDLSPLAADDSHSLYRITLYFDARMIEYPGGAISETELMSFELENLPLSEPSANLRVLSQAFWDGYADRARGERSDYEDYWNNRNNPRHPAFYQGYYSYDERNQKFARASRNFLVSDLGIIAQRDASNRLTVAVSRLLTAEPAANVTVSVLDSRLQRIAVMRTDSSGLASVASAAEAALVVADTETTESYLRLQGASYLPVNNFDVTGQEVQQGVKGFLYGERGVWRPGDPIYLTFILEDKNKALPADHPVILSLYDPSGRLLKTVRKSDPVGNSYAFTLETASDAPTGDYQAKVTVGGVSFSKLLSVETVKPNRLAISLGFGAGVQELTTEPATGSVESRWLHGAIAGDMKVDVAVQLSSLPTEFPAYRGYTFDDPVRVFRAETKEIFAGTLQADGKVSFPLNLASDGVAPGRLKAAFRTRVYEPSGNTNVDTVSFPFHPVREYAGVRIPDAETGKGWLNVDQSHEVRIALVDPQGKPVPSGEVEVSLYGMGWRWWWDRQDNNIADYLGNKEYKLVSSQRVAVNGGSAKWTLKLAERVWGRYLVRVQDVNGSHATGMIVYLRWPGWYYTSPEGGADAANMLVFSADKESYTIGETARITIPTADKGRALVSIENNGVIIRSEWIPTQAGQTIYALKLTDKMTPNIYLHVSHVQPHGQTVNDRPLRMYGIIPIGVIDPATQLKPVLRAPDVFEPNSRVAVSVSEASGRPMTYTLAVVDEGLLNLTRFTVPDPWARFYKRDASAVSTFDMYGFVAAAYGGALERLLAIGGGEESLEGEGRKANRFPPMVRFLGPFALEKGKTRSHAIDIPQYLGSVRVMLVAGEDGAYGSAEKQVPVRKPVMVYGTLPRVASVTEQLALPVTVFTMEDAISSVDVSVKATGKLKLSGESRRTLKFTRSAEQTVTFDLAAEASPGLAEVEITATSGSISSSQKIEIDVRVPNAPITNAESFALAKGESRDRPIELPGLPGTNQVVLELSRIAPVNLKERLGYLIEYPYGCIEQTTSAAFPQLYLDKITQLSSLQAGEVQRNVQATIDRLTHFQTGGGGFGFWPGDQNPSSYATVYAVHFLIEAEALGYVVPQGMKRSALGFLRFMVGRWAWGIDRSDLVQAYALYDLALAGEPDLGAMNRMRERLNLPVEVRFKLAAAYTLAGQKEEALRLSQGSIPPFSPYSEQGGTYGSDLRDMAFLAEGFLAAGLMSQAASVINDISKGLSSDRWYATQSTAYGLLVVGKYLATTKPGAPLKASYEWAGQRQTVETAAPVQQLPLSLGDQSQTASRPLRVRNDSQEPLFVRILKTGNPAPGKETAGANGLNLSVDYLAGGGGPLDVASLAQGTDIVVELTVRNPTSRNYEKLALSYIAPAGWEITNPRFEGWTQNGRAVFDYQDVRDDRVYTHFDLESGQTKTLTLMLNASYLGSFYLPQAKVEAMYDASVYASGKGQWIKVRAADSPSPVR